MTKNSKVKIVADPITGSVIHLSTNNPEYGYIKLEQVKTVIDDNGFLKKQIMSALIHGPVGILKEMNYKADQELEGRIVVQESLTPWNKKNPENDLKIAGKTGIVCRIENQPIYRRTIYTEKENVVDTFIAHDNGQELRIAYEKNLKASLSMPVNEDFKL